jgi:hypothetical protein
MTATVAAHDTPATAVPIASPARPPRPKSHLTPAECEHIIRLRETGHTITQTALLTGRSREVIRRIAPHTIHDRQPPPTARTPRCDRCRQQRPASDYERSSRICATCRERDPKLPAGPLVAVIERYMRVMDVTYRDACKLIGQDERTVTFWRSGARDVPRSVADETLFILERGWWDAYNEDHVRFYRINTPIYAERRKRIGGKWGLYRERVGRRQEDEQGVDWVTLARCIWAFDPYEAVMRLRKRLDLPYGQVADLCGVSEQRVRDVIVAAHAHKLDAAA